MMEDIKKTAREEIEAERARADAAVARADAAVIRADAEVVRAEAHTADWKKLVEQEREWRQACSVRPRKALVLQNRGGRGQWVAE